MYLTYTEYQNMGGELDETAFTQLEFEASTYINRITFDRLIRNSLQTIPIELKRCIYRLVDLLSIKQITISGTVDDGKAVGNVIKQENDGVSISYGSVSTRQHIIVSEQEMGKVVRYFLANIRDGKGQLILFRGLYPGE